MDLHIQADNVIVRLGFINVTWEIVILSASLSICLLALQFVLYPLSCCVWS